MSLRRFIVYFCALAACCISAFGQWVPQMPALDGFPIDLAGHTAPIDVVTGLVTLTEDAPHTQNLPALPPPPEAVAIWSRVLREQKLSVASLPR